MDFNAATPISSTETETFQSLIGILMDFNPKRDSKPRTLTVSIPDRDFNGFQPIPKKEEEQVLILFQSLIGILMDFNSRAASQS